MNSSSALRNSVYGLDGRQELTLGLPARPKARDALDPADAEAQAKVVRRRTFVPIAYPEYSTSCRDEKVVELEDHIFDVEVTADPLTVGQQTIRMLTYYPWRDMNWLVAMGFVVGSISFTINAVLGMLPAFDPASVTQEVKDATLYTLLFGAVLFVVGGLLALPAVWNTEAQSVGKMLYKPVLLGSPQWAWLPTGAQFGRLIRTVPFQTGLVQLSGGFILSASIPTAFPGVLDPEDLLSFQLFAAGPLALGGSLFFVANVTLTFWLQERWFRPKWGVAAWQGAFWSTIGSANFAMTGFALLIGDFVTAAVATLIGSVAFLMGAVFQLFDIMAFHPDDWATS